MGEMIKNEREHNQSAQHHRARSERRLHVLLLFVSDRPGPPIFERETDRVKNMQDHSNEKKTANHPEDGAQLAQMFRVGIDPIRPEKNLEVAEQMADDERDKNDAGDGDDHFFADGRAKE